MGRGKKEEEGGGDKRERERAYPRERLESVVGARFSFGSFYESDRVDY